MFLMRKEINWEGELFEMKRNIPGKELFLYRNYPEISSARLSLICMKPGNLLM